MTELSDIELLNAYATQRSEDAFRELVSRHVDFIYSAAWRQLGNPQLAQEATQSAFIALAGKAGHLGPQTIIAGWLHHAVHFAALKLQRTEARRAHWEREAAAAVTPAEDEQTFQEHVLPQVDAALNELGAVERDALILRFLQQKSLRDVAHTLGTSEEAAKKRVTRALDKLRALLVRRGVAISAVALGAGLSQVSVCAAPTTLLTTVSALAASTAVPATGAGALSLFTYAKTAALPIVGGLVLCGALTVLLWPRRPANPVPAARNTVATVTNPVTPVTNVLAAVNNTAPPMKIKLTSVMVDDQDKALRFYTGLLGFVKKRDLPTGNDRWLTVVSPAEPDGTELLLEPMGFAPARVFQAALYKAGVPHTAFLAEDIQREFERLTNLGVRFSMPPTKAGPTIIAVLLDTCGNRIQLFQPPGINSTGATPAIKLAFTSIMVRDQEKALKFYTEILGFVKKTDMPAGGGRWLTVVSPDEPDGMELVLEPMGFAFALTYQKALFDAGIPWTTLFVADIQKQYERLAKSGVAFSMKPTKAGPTTMAIFDDTCGNLIQIAQP